MIDLPVNEIFADPEFNCRGAIAPIDVVDLMQSIERNGLIQPIVVQPYTKNGYKYRTIAGHRRLKAFQCLKRETVPAIVRDNIDETQARVINFLENLERKNLTIMQEARSIEKFMGRFSYNEIGKMIGKSYGWIQIRLSALRLPPNIQAEIDSGMISQYQIKDIFALPTEDMQMAAVREIKDARLRGDKRKIHIKEVKRNKISTTPKSERRQTEIFEMQDLIAEHLGHSLTTRVLGWATGYVSTDDIYAEIKTEAEKAGKIFAIPTKTGS